jgi:hypothetical protein
MRRQFSTESALPALTMNRVIPRSTYGRSLCSIAAGSPWMIEFRIWSAGRPNSFVRRLTAESGSSPTQITVRQADPTLLRQAFLWRETRTVTRTATLSLQGNRYSVDPVLAGQQVELRFDPFDLTAIQVWQDSHFVAHAQVQKLERARHLSSDRLPFRSRTANGKSGRRVMLGQSVRISRIAASR